jgi:hypothetical protein
MSMLDSQVLEVAIGLVVMFFLLALASSSIVEAIAGVFNIRGKQLETAIKGLVSDPQHTLDVWSTSVFAALQAGTRTTASGNASVKKRTRKPAYVSAHAFADATIEAISARKALSTSTTELEGQLPSNLKSRLDALTNEVGADLNGIKAGLEAWFDDTMERTAGAYKRWAQIVLVVVALALAIALNASTTRVAATIWNDATVRDAVVNASRNVNQVKTPGGLRNVGITISNLESLHLPLGWRDWHSQAGPIGTIAGWFITALLVMLGAPFWYGLLTRLVSLRTAGDKPPPAIQDPTSASAALAARTNPPSGAVSLTDALDAIPAIAAPQ